MVSKRHLKKNLKLALQKRLYSASKANDELEMILPYIVHNSLSGWSSGDVYAIASIKDAYTDKKH